ncbi:MAG: M28 family peptidase [Bryobacteraceae bacterium]|nr:M28 family peptidase [Bryobacteraceae bacterium]
MTTVAILALLLSQAVAQTRAPEIESITRAEMEADLHFLASDTMRGRLTGTEEYLQAAKFIESRFRRIGLKPAGPGPAYEHPFTLLWSELADGNLFRITHGATSQPKLLEEFMPLFFSASARARAKVTFAGFGIDAPMLKWNDLSGGAIAGRILLMLDGEPAPDDPKSIFDGVVTSIHADPLRKALAAQDHGALAVLFVNGRQKSDGVHRFTSEARAYWPPKPPHLKRYALTSQTDRLRIPVATISPAAAQILLGNRQLADLLIQSETGITPIPLDHEAEIAVSLKRHIVEDRNIVAMVEGSGLKQEAVIISAHYDHNGAEGNQIYNGADDNGSGTVALLDIAEAYAQAARRGQRPERTVIFAAWGSEERCCGPLLGAWAWLANPPFPLEKTVAVLNMDMIGRSEEVPEGGGARFRGLPIQTAASNAGAVNIIGASYSPDLRQAVIAANSGIDLLLRQRYDNNRSNLLRRSDHWVFLNHGIPALWFHTGLHPDYHTAFDRPEKIDYPKMERVARLVHQLSWNLAQQPSRPRMLQPRPIPPPD